MIIFYNKKTGKIVGTIEGRLHGKEDLKMWIGSREDSDRLVVVWTKNKKGFFEPSVKNKAFKNILIELDKKKLNIYDFVVDTNTARLTRRGKNE